MTVTKIVLRLDSRVPFDNALLHRYSALPRHRRQEMLRTLIQRGLEVEGFAGEQSSHPSAAIAPVVTVSARALDPVLEAPKSGKALVGLFTKKSDSSSPST